MIRLLAIGAAAIALLAPVARADDGAGLHQYYDASDRLVHTDITTTYAGGGGGSYVPYYGIGTIRVTLPAAAGVTLPHFAGAASEPAAEACKVDAGAYGQADTGYICTFPGQRLEAEVLFPEMVVLHLVSATCYPYPDIAGKQPARVDVWTAHDVTDGAPDASYPIASNEPCSVPPAPAPPSSGGGTPTATKTCTVPNVKKLTLKRAKAKLKKAGCAAGVVKKAFSKKIKKGRVIAQSVKPRTKVKRGTRVRLTISKGRK